MSFEYFIEADKKIPTITPPLIDNNVYEYVCLFLLPTVNNVIYNFAFVKLSSIVYSPEWAFKHTNLACIHVNGQWHVICHRYNESGIIINMYLLSYKNHCYLRHFYRYFFKLLPCQRCSSTVFIMVLSLYLLSNRRIIFNNFISRKFRFRTVKNR